MRRSATIVSLLGLLLVLAGSAQAVPNFPDWSKDVQTWDAAGLLSAEAKQAVAEKQKALRAQYGVGLWVVLLDSQKRYTSDPGPIEAFAASLIDQKIRSLAGNEDFILLLVCKEDRKSRIQLGTAWDNQWNDGCDLITQSALVANFKVAQYEQGVVQAVEALAEMTARKNQPPPFGEVGSLLTRWGSQLGASSNLPPLYIIPAAACGGLVLLAGLAIASYRTPLALLGMLIMTMALFSKAVGWLIPIVAIIWLLSKADWSRGGSYSNHESFFMDDGVHQEDTSRNSGCLFGGVSSSSDSGFFSSSSDSSWSSSSDSSWSSSSDSSSSSSDWGGGGGSTGEW